jgi:hypothetical protein
MLDPGVETAVRLLGGAWWGLAIGLIGGSWGTPLALITAAYGVMLAADAWFFPPAPSKAVKRDWKDTKASGRRGIMRAVARGGPVARVGDAYLAARVAREIAETPISARYLATRAAWLATLAAVVVIAGLSGAPPLWVALAVAFVVGATLSAIEAARPRTRERVRRAADTNLALAARG